MYLQIYIYIYILALRESISGRFANIQKNQNQNLTLGLTYNYWVLLTQHRVTVSARIRSEGVRPNRVQNPYHLQFLTSQRCTNSQLASIVHGWIMQLEPAPIMPVRMPIVAYKWAFGIYTHHEPWKISRLQANLRLLLRHANL